MNRSLVLVTVASASALVSGLLSTVTAQPAAAATTPATPHARPLVLQSGVFGPYAPGRKAVTYRPDLVPVGARAGVISITSTHGTLVMLAVHGLKPNRQYGAHVHTKPCGAKPADSGPHYQHVKDPVSPSVDPRYANPDNEVWLDFTTDATGTGVAVASQGWMFRPGEANSVVIHAEHTHTEPGHAGTAGERLACLTIPF
ncbi:superoxide dismutase [Carbonactinospora thermoautotrophica]|uniref:superoxide dismutase family protein n=1 Tax=Carbonactinospora thermoautotrophica TaxID=1469144 RepID=UPI00226EB860|nr:superoxide dismutase family protein [Carbonactinospora thermoautotrophica]MCX9190720.1 superoxide dismutase [Carbonactinospora thermoautotrophica]